MNKKHIRSIDFWKGVTILSVLNIHACFWSGTLYLPDWTRQLALLLDVPVFFFISGFLLQSPETGTILRRSKNQIIRLFIDYAGITLAASVLTVIGATAFGIAWFHELIPAIISAWLFQYNGPLWSFWVGLSFSIWYLKVYVLILFLGIPILCSPLRRLSGYLPWMSYAVFLLVTIFPHVMPSMLLKPAKFIFFYLALFLAGAALKNTIGRLSLSRLSLVWALLLAITMGVIFREGSFPNLQAVKFPPSSLYLLFSMHSIMALCFLIVLENTNRIGETRSRLSSFVSWCGRNTYRIYLLQGFAASLPIYYVPHLLKMHLPDWVIYGAALISNIGISLVLTHGYNGLESAIAKRWKGRSFLSSKAEPVQ